jgi:hypothetical protein
MYHIVKQQEEVELMAILSFSMTKDEFLKGSKTVTRRSWSDKHFEMWVNFWETERYIHDAWDNIPRAGGKKIGEIQLTEKPYREKLKDMPVSDLIAEGGMCTSIEEFIELIGKTPDDYVTVVRFTKI